MIVTERTLIERINRELKNQNGRLVRPAKKMRDGRRDYFLLALSDDSLKRRVKPQELEALAKQLGVLFDGEKLVRAEPAVPARR